MSAIFGFTRLGRVQAALALVLGCLLAPTVSAQQISNVPYHANSSAAAQDQPTNQGGYSSQRSNSNDLNSLLSHLTIEAGAGFNRPVGYARTFATWGGNVSLGAGWKFTRWFSTMAEWQFLSDKIPGNYLAQAGVPGGHIHVWGLTLEPTYTYQSSGRWGGYAFAGGGFYRRVTTFTVPQLQQQCYYFCYQQYVNVPVAHYSSNQGGWNAGGGVTWKISTMDSYGRLFVEARYLRVDSPSANVFGTQDGQFTAVPVSVGFRW